jgi:hypothetical protein
MAPFVVSGARPGLEVVQPMAVVIVGGLLTVGFVSLFVLPLVYLRYGSPTADLETGARVVRQWTPLVTASEAPVTVSPQGTATNGDATEGNGGPAATAGNGTAANTEPER